MSELKNCPFCGGEAVFVKCDEPDSYRVMCSDVGVCTASSDGEGVQGYGDEKTATERWNTRAPLTEE